MEFLFAGFVVGFFVGIAFSFIMNGLSKSTYIPNLLPGCYYYLPDGRRIMIRYVDVNHHYSSFEGDHCWYQIDNDLTIYTIPMNVARTTFTEKHVGCDINRET